MSAAIAASPATNDRIAAPGHWFLGALRCPDCADALHCDEGGYRCVHCAFTAPAGKDLRPQKPSTAAMSFSRLGPGHLDAGLSGIDLSAPQHRFDGPPARRDSRELMSEIAARLAGGGAALDLGCGPRDQAPPLEQLGFRYVGMDYMNPAADILGDAHALPFADDSFDCVLSYAVLEHLHNPFVALAEIARVLRPGGWFVGTVSQGEPFHSSYFHHTPWGLLSVVQSNPQLSLRRLWPGPGTLDSLASMGRYPKPVRLMLAGVALLNARLPWLAPRKMKWPARDRRIDQLYSAGSLCFSIQKTSEAPNGAPA